MSDQECFTCSEMWQGCSNCTASGCNDCESGYSLNQSSFTGNCIANASNLIDGLGLVAILLIIFGSLAFIALVIGLYCCCCRVKKEIDIQTSKENGISFLENNKNEGGQGF